MAKEKDLMNVSKAPEKNKGATVPVMTKPTKEITQTIGIIQLLEIEKGSNGNSVHFVQSIPKDVWFRLSRWTREHNLYQGWERKILYNIGLYLQTVTEKQAEHGKRMITEAVQKGFE